MPEDAPVATVIVLLLLPEPLRLLRRIGLNDAGLRSVLTLGFVLSAGSIVVGGTLDAGWMGYVGFYWLLRIHLFRPPEDRARARSHDWFGC